jgi:hypothetical protein
MSSCFVILITADNYSFSLSCGKILVHQTKTPPGCPGGVFWV